MAARMRARQDLVQTRDHDEPHSSAGSALAGRGNAVAQERLRSARQSRGAPLPGRLAARAEAAFGVDLSGIQVHDDDAAHALAADVEAAAFTMGAHLFFGEGWWDPDSKAGEQLLLHELGHAVNGRANGSVGEQSASGDAHEQRADQVANLARSRLDDDTTPPSPALATMVQPVDVASAPDGPIQRQQLPGSESSTKVGPGTGYHDGNRPEPAQTNNSLYELHSDAPRVLTVGDGVTYEIVQTHEAMQSADSVTTTKWRIHNDPASGLPSDTITTDRWKLTLHASVPGVHEIEVEMALDSRPLALLRYTQVVVDNNATYAEVGDVSPAPLGTMQDFIALVQRVEAAHSGLAWQDVCSKLRKEYYPGKRGRYGGIKAAFTWDDLIDEQQDMSPLQSPPTAAADIAALRQRQVVHTDGGSVDIGHLLTGVDSMNFPSVAGIFESHNMDGPAAATWSGDVGSALVHWATDHPLDDDSDAGREDFYTRYAGMDDLIGDVDGIAIADLDGLPSSAPLSERLRAYYVDSVQKGANRRWHNFCRVSGFDTDNGRLASSSRDYIRQQVLAFAQGYNIQGSITDGLILGGGAGPDPRITPELRESTSFSRIRRAVDWFVDRFIADIEAGLTGER